MTRGLYLLGRWCAEHGLLVLGLWLAALLSLGAADRLLPPPALEPFVLSGTESAQAQTLMNRAFPGSSSEAAPLVVHDELDLSRGAGAELIRAVTAAVADADGVSVVKSPLGEPDEQYSDDRRTAIIMVTMAERAAGDAGAGEAMFGAAQQAARDHSPTVVVALGGYLGQQISRTNTRSSEVLGLLMAVLVLLHALRRAWPVLIPLATAIMAVGIGLTAIRLLGRMVYIPDEAPTLGMMLGLGVGIDYALFLVTRHRNLLAKGFPVTDAVGRTAGTAGAGMVFAGATLLAAVGGLALTGISFLAWLGYSAAVVVAVALGAALTLVPSLLGMMGPRVLPRAAARAYVSGEVRDTAPSDEDLDRGLWARIATTVTSHPWRYAIGASVLLLTLAAPMLTMRFQQVDASALPDQTPAHVAQDLMAAAFGAGTTGPLAVVGQLYRVATPPEEPQPVPEGDPRARDERLTEISAILADTPGIDTVTDPVVSTDGGVVIWRVTPTSGPSDPRTEALVAHLRTTVLPGATSGRDMSAYVGGVTAARTDLTARVAERLLPFIIGVASLSFLLLLIAYRSLVIPAKAAAMNLVSIAAAYGVVVMIFQWGWGTGMIGLDGPVPIESYVPMMMFAILFGLSMDYEVFLLTAFQEHYHRTGDIVTAIRRGLADTGQLITSAALIMVAVFLSFIIPDNSVIKMFGVGLATAVLVDATVVRCVLVPSLMVLAAKQTWWLPSWLDRLLPQLHVEGDPAQLETIGRARPAGPQDDLPGARPVAVAVGVLAAWWIGTRVAVDVSSTPAAGLAVALSASSGALLAWLPRSTPRGAGTPAPRLLGLILGCLLSAAAYLGVGSLSAATSRNPALQAACSILVPAALIGLTALRRWALPIGLGVVTMGAALAVTAVTPAELGGPLLTAVVPAMIALAVARALTAWSQPRSTGRQVPA